MTFTAQPYPLYAAFWNDDSKLDVALIIGWSAPNGDDLNSSRIQPIALHQNSDGSSTEPKYIELDGDDAYWVDTTAENARRRAVEGTSA